MGNNVGSQEILRQLGGTRFVMMTGAKNLLGGDDPIRLSFKIGKGAKSKITHVRITLTPRDTYLMEFVQIRGTSTNRVVVSHDDVYAEDLQRVFTAETGLYTSL